jgi:hypothetical protein
LLIYPLAGRAAQIDLPTLLGQCGGVTPSPSELRDAVNGTDPFVYLKELVINESPDAQFSLRAVVVESMGILAERSSLGPTIKALTGYIHDAPLFACGQLCQVAKSTWGTSGDPVTAILPGFSEEQVADYRLADIKARSSVPLALGHILATLDSEPANSRSVSLSVSNDVLEMLETIATESVKQVKSPWCRVQSRSAELTTEEIACVRQVQLNAVRGLAIAGTENAIRRLKQIATDSSISPLISAVAKELLEDLEGPHAIKTPTPIYTAGFFKR